MGKEDEGCAENRDCSGGSLAQREDETKSRARRGRTFEGSRLVTESIEPRFQCAGSRFACKLCMGVPLFRDAIHQPLVSKVAMMKHSLNGLPDIGDVSVFDQGSALLSIAVTAEPAATVKRSIVSLQLRYHSDLHVSRSALKRCMSRKKRKESERINFTTEKAGTRSRPRSTHLCGSDFAHSPSRLLTRSCGFGPSLPAGAMTGGPKLFWAALSSTAKYVYHHLLP